MSLSIPMRKKKIMSSLSSPVASSYPFSWLIFILTLVTSTTGWAAPGGGRATPVQVAEAKMLTLAPETWVAGTVIPRQKAVLSAEVEGRLESVVEVGTQVKAGDVLARVDATFVQLKVAEMRASIAREAARLEFYEAEAKRLQRLATQNNAAQTQLDQTRADGEVARNDLSIARTRLKQAQEELRRHEIRAPFAGVVAERLLQRGERVAVGDAVVQVVDKQNLEVQARIPLAVKAFVKAGDKVKLKVDGVVSQAPVRTLVAVGDDRSRLLELRVSVPDGQWVVGQPVRVAIPTARAQSVLAVPRDALVLRRDGASVFRITVDNKSERVPVELGVASGEFIEVKGKLQAGDQVVIRGGERLRPGMDVKILAAQRPAANGQ
jgi:RND family efflux transporter MFP subunit